MEEITDEQRARRLVAHLKAAGERFDDEDYIVHELVATFSAVRRDQMRDT